MRYLKRYVEEVQGSHAFLRATYIQLQRAAVQEMNYKSLAYFLQTIIGAPFVLL